MVKLHNTKTGDCEVYVKGVYVGLLGIEVDDTYVLLTSTLHNSRITVYDRESLETYAVLAFCRITGIG